MACSVWTWGAACGGPAQILCTPDRWSARLSRLCPSHPSRGSPGKALSLVSWNNSFGDFLRGGGEIFLGVGVSGDFKMASPALKHSLWYLLEVQWWCRLPDISSVTFPSSERSDYSLCCQGHLFPFGLLNEVFVKTGCSSKCFLFLFMLLSAGWLSYVVGETAKVFGLL